MRRMRVVLTMGAVGVAGVVLLAGAGPASGQEPGGTATVDEVAAAITEDGWYADGDAVGDREQLADVAVRLAGEDEPMGFALLAEEPPGSSTQYAEQVLDRLPAQGEVTVRTVVVLSDADVGVVSDVWSDGAIDAALDDTIDDLRDDPTDGLEALAGSLAAQPSGVDDGGSDTGGGPNTGLIVGGVALVVAVSVGRRLLSGADGDTDGDGGSSWRRRRRSSFFRSSRRHRRSSRSGSRRRSSSGSRRGRGGRRL